MTPEEYRGKYLFAIAVSDREQKGLVKALDEATEAFSKAIRDAHDDAAKIADVVLRERIAELEGTLEKIADHPMQFSMPRDDSYWSRLAMQLATIAREARIKT